MTQATDVLIPTSPDDAAAAFGDGSGVTVIGGGTILVPEITHGRLRPAKALLLARAGLSGVTQDGTRVTIGAATPVQALVDLAAPLGPCAANVADVEIRSQGTVGGNLCAGPGPDAPRGDLQGALLALDATVRSTGLRWRAQRAAGRLPRRPRRAAAARRLATTSPRRAPTRRSTTRTRTSTRCSRCRARRAPTARSASPPAVSPGPPSCCRATRTRRRRRSRSATTRSRPPGIARRRCPCSSAVS